MLGPSGGEKCGLTGKRGEATHDKLQSGWRTVLVRVGDPPQAETIRFAPQPPPQWRLAHSPVLSSEARLRGITTRGEQLALSRPRNGRAGPVDIPAGR